jgi:catechol 2,3-dioxygenase-like lactoylglutathione lyase family enzyme
VPTPTEERDVMARAVFEQVNIVVSDMDAALDFYRRLGLDAEDRVGEWPPGSGARHVDAQKTEPHLDLDNVPMGAIWARGTVAPGTPVIGFSLPSREAVDATYADLVAAGHRGRVEPYDAFFGARYAIVDDPDGNAVGLMSPREDDRRYVPSP